MDILGAIADSHFNFTNPILNKSWVVNTITEKTIKVAALVFTIFSCLVIGRSNLFSFRSYVMNQLTTLILGSKIHEALSICFRVFNFGEYSDAATVMKKHLADLTQSQFQKIDVVELLEGTSTPINKTSIRTATNVLIEASKYNRAF